VEFCRHSEGTFIGIQQDPFRGVCFALFTCNSCMTTYSMPLTYREAMVEFHSLDVEMQLEQQVA